MFVFLTALEYIQYWRGNPKALKRPYLLLDLEDTRRVFLVDKDKIISFGFRLNVKTQLSDITDIFCGEGITETHHSDSSVHGMEQTIEICKRDFRGKTDIEQLFG